VTGRNFVTNSAKCLACPSQQPSQSGQRLQTDRKSRPDWQVAVMAGDFASYAARTRSPKSSPVRVRRPLMKLRSGASRPAVAGQRRVGWPGLERGTNEAPLCVFRKQRSGASFAGSVQPRPPRLESLRRSTTCRTPLPAASRQTTCVWPASWTSSSSSWARSEIRLPPFSDVSAVSNQFEICSARGRPMRRR
jgi:hypothetical protein